MGGVTNMCHQFYERPYTVVLKQRHTKKGTLVLIYSLLLGKVTEKRNGQHISTNNFGWPIGRIVHDSNAVVGHHGRALHFAASPDSTKKLGSYGSHRLAVLPAPAIWDPIRKDSYAPRCWHSSGGIATFCLDCDGIELDVINNPDFWQDLKRPRRFPGGVSLTQLLADKSVWHKQVEVNLN
jgi:hypothetical protein